MQFGDARGCLEAATKGLTVDACSGFLLDDALEAATVTDDTNATRRLRSRRGDEVGVLDPTVSGHGQ